MLNTGALRQGGAGMRLDTARGGTPQHDLRLVRPATTRQVRPATPQIRPATRPTLQLNHQLRPAASPSTGGGE